MATGTSSEKSDDGTAVSAGFPPLPYRTGAVAGAGAVLVGYLTTVLLTATRALDVAASGPAPTDTLPGWKAVGWLFYNAHGVVVRFVDGGGGAVGIDFVEASGGALAPLYLVPPVVLLVAGGITAFRAGETRPKRAAAAGVTVTTGYAVALLAGILLFGASLGPYTAAPGVPLASAVGYPLAFGAMGGVAAAVLSLTPAANR
jgi:hypothetical protein